MSKHNKGSDQHGKPSPQREQGAGQNRDQRQPNEGGAQERGAQERGAQQNRPQSTQTGGDRNR